jgi:2-polyprenyl-3-methyl-5-hydroxy-6-metoxy-1,4-benzoquinol methylase
MNEHFDFGKNWQEFSEQALSEKNIKQAAKEFGCLFEGILLEDRTFLDIGFGQGLSLLLATRKGACTFGNDINPLCAQVLDYNRRKFPDIESREIPVVVGSFLKRQTIEALENLTPEKKFDIVHSWGVLHHTGEMWKAIEHAVMLVAPDGHFVLAIYNRHWTAPIWKRIKLAYIGSPAVLRNLMVWLYLGASAIKMLAVGENPFVRQRGMDIYYDAVDWVGGYPYEYASREEIVAFMQKKGFALTKFIPTRGFTGCNEFVFHKQS